MAMRLCSMSNRAIEDGAQDRLDPASKYELRQLIKLYGLLRIQRALTEIVEEQERDG